MTEEAVTCKDYRGNCGKTPDEGKEFKADFTILLSDHIEFALVYSCQPYWWFMGKDEKFNIWAKSTELRDDYLK